MSTKNEDAIAPHGGKLVNRDASPDERKAWTAKARELQRLTLGPREVSDLELIASGGFSPLEGFMTSGDYASVVSDMHLASGLPWSIPVTLSTRNAWFSAPSRNFSSSRRLNSGVAPAEIIA